MHAVTDWPPDDVDVREAAIDYLAFLAARDELRRRSRSGFALFTRLLAATTGRGMTSTRGTAEWREVESEKFQDYVLATYAVAQRFNGEDRNVLRLSGILPPGFFDEVEKQVRRDRG